MRYMIAVILVLLSAGLARGQDSLSVEDAIREFESTLGYRTGDIQLPNGVATIHVPDGFRYLDKIGAQRLLTDGWGNPVKASEDVIGMLIPPGSPLSEDGWGIVLNMDESGYVDDKNAAKLDYGKILKQMRKGLEESNAERIRQGFETMTLVGWAEPPHYDTVNHKLYWAKDIVVGTNQVHTLNYCIRVLGRRGVLELNAVARMDQLEEIHQNTPAVLAGIEFNEGHRYTDFIKGKDRVAEVGLAGLIIGVAAKAGFFKALIVAILAFKKLIIVGILALFALLKRTLAGKTMPPTPGG